MTSREILNDLLDKTVRADGESLYGLATVIMSRLPFLRFVLRRQKTLRADRRVLDLGIGIDADAQILLDKNLNLAAHLIRDALRAGLDTDDADAALAECLYELREYSAALALVRDVNTPKVRSERLRRVHARLLLAAGDGNQEELANLVGLGADRIRRLEIVDHRDFERWARLADAECVTISDVPVSVTGPFRFCTDTGIHEFRHSLDAPVLQGARKQELHVYSGFLPFSNGYGYYHEEAMNSVTDSPLTVEYANTAFVHDGGMVKSTRFSGKHLLPCAPHRYFEQYSHGIVQIYARLVATISTGHFDDHGILLPERTPGWVFKFLENAGVSTHRIQKMPLNTISEVEEAVVLPMNWEINPFEIREMQKALDQGRRRSTGEAKYYLTRKNVKNFHRSLTNEEEFIEVCEKRGFQIVDPLEYPIEEQVELFRKAKIIVTSDSSADTNMIYAPPGAEVIIVIPGRFGAMLMAEVATCCGHTMSVVVGDYLAGDRHVEHTNGPYRADPKLLEELLDRLS